MSGPCDDELYKNVTANYTACNFIYDHLEDCEGESIINYRIVYFCYWNQSLWAAIPIGVNKSPIFNKKIRH